MKKIFLLLIAMLMLSGCNAEQPEETTLPPTQPPTEPGIYVADSAYETESEGALRQYDIDGTPIGVGVHGKDVMVFTQAQDQCVLLKTYSTDHGYLRNETLLESGAVPGTGTFVPDGDGYLYYSEKSSAVIRLDRDFKERKRYALPTEMTGNPVISADNDMVFFTLGTSVHALDMNTELTRMIGRYTCQTLTLWDVAFHGTVAVCHVQREDGTSYTDYILTDNGTPLGSDQTTFAFTAADDRYLLERNESILREVVFGTSDAAPMALYPLGQWQEVKLLPQLNSAMTVDLTDGQLLLQVYDLETGKRTAELKLPKISRLHSVCDTENGLWLLVSDEAGEPVLLFWDTSASAPTDENTYISVRYTAENPDMEALEQCRLTADAMEENYGVTLQLTPEEAATPDGYVLTAEHRAEAIELGLKALDTAMAKFPEGFFSKMAKITDDRTVYITLVRDISGDQQNHQYWRGENAYIALEIGEATQEEFYHALCHVLDTYLLANSKLLDDWDKLNPKGFAYDGNYFGYEAHADSEFLQGDTRAFVDAYSMTFAKEDRAAILAAAMAQEDTSVFASATMQAKLKLLCRTIRDAFGWRKETVEFPWEQYLEEPLAYVKKK